MEQTLRLVIDCPDQVGLVASVSQFLAQHNATIVEASHHTDLQTCLLYTSPSPRD